MLKRYGFIVFALGLFFAASSLAQESGEEALDQQTEVDGQNAGKGSLAPLGLPVRILEDPEEAEGAKRAQSRAEQREIDDLVAQQNAAEAAEGAVKVGIAQTLLAFFGTVALIYSLNLNRRATKAAVKAVEIAESTGISQVRAYVGVGTGSPSIHNGPIRATITVKNFGQSAAKEVKACLRWYCGSEFCKDYDISSAAPQAVGTLAPSQESIAEIDTSVPDDAVVREAIFTDAEPIRAGTTKFWFFGEIRYRDAFGTSHVTSFRYILVPGPKPQFNLCDDGNDMT
jgi:hypothetical protein